MAGPAVGVLYAEGDARIVVRKVITGVVLVLCMALCSDSEVKEVDDIVVPELLSVGMRVDVVLGRVVGSCAV